MKPQWWIRARGSCSLTNRLTLRQLTNAWLLLWEATFRSEDGDVTFGDQEEMGFGVRVATTITEKNGGVITSSAALKSRFAWWPSSENAGGVRVDPHQLQLLLWNGDPSRAAVAPMWRAVTTAG